MPHDRDIALTYAHRVRFTRGAFAPGNPLLGELMHAPGQSPRKAMVVVDRGLLDAWPDLEQRITAYFTAHATRLPKLVGFRAVPGGEESKNDLGILEGLLGDVHRTGLCRHSFLIAIGGGAVLDMAGFVAAVAHRGVRLLRMPTTTLAQNDAGIGVKNGVNMFGKKNFLGTFAVPWAVVNDLDLLTTLPDRDWRAGLSEAVKVALLKDPDFYTQIEQEAPRLAARDASIGDRVWQRCAALHLDHIAGGGDPFESAAARPLDFGHWAAHKLEAMTNFDLRHGEAVAIGLAIDVVYSHLIGHLDRPTADRILVCLETLGFTLHHDALRDADTLLTGLDEFREHLGGELTITLLRGIGQPIDVHTIDEPTMRQAIASLEPLADALAVGSI
ncbi:MAG: 3-dehydroquinate synthase [Planctomycetes bacterium]|jgi:3-dehydroquinate synthase|nr:3-dehydroquinate synthase [Planctomycetota bacterium]